MKAIETLRLVSPRAAAQLALSYIVLLVGCLLGRFPYVVLQALLAAELVLLTLATIPFYPERGILTHLFDLLKLTGCLAFVLFFLVISYGVASEGDNGNALAAGVRGLRDTPPSAMGWALAYFAVQLAVSLWQAWHSQNPRAAWARSNLGQGGATFVSMFLMVFVGFFFARPIVMGFSMLGIAVDANIVLATLMVIVRYFMALVLSTMSASEVDQIAANPYVDRAH
ncbi:MAG: hypothetical protein ABIW82_04130 [Dokdonella sp.]